MVIDVDKKEARGSDEKGVRKKTETGRRSARSSPSRRTLRRSESANLWARSIDVTISFARICSTIWKVVSDWTFSCSADICKSVVSCSKPAKSDTGRAWRSTTPSDINRPASTSSSVGFTRPQNPTITAGCCASSPSFPPCRRGERESESEARFFAPPVAASDFFGRGPGSEK